MNLRPLQFTAMLVTAAAAAAPASPVAGQKALLRWKYEPGSELVYRMTNDQQIDLAAMGGSATSRQVQTMRWRVTDVASNGDATIVVTTERVQMEMSGITGNVSYDSDTGELPAEPQYRALAGLVGASYTVVVGSTGEVRSVSGMDAVRRQVMEAMPPDQRAVAQTVTDQMFSDEAMSNMMQQSFQLFPEQPVGPGDSWPSSFSISIPMLGTMSTNLTYSFVGLEERDGRTVATINVAGDLSFGRDETSQMPMPMDISDTRMTGSLQFDADLGTTLSSDMATTMQMSVGAGGQQMTVALDQRTKVELVEHVRGR